MLKEYLENDIKLNKKQLVVVFCIIFVASGMFGWLYEFIFYWMNGGFQTFYLQGSNYLPWINIYMYGAFLIIFLTYRFRKKPYLVFLISALSTGILEYLTGYIIYGKLGWVRCWDYNQEILNFGNIDGYVCLRSVLVFGICGLILIYFMLPLCFKIVQKYDLKKLLIVTITVASIFFIDNAYNFIFWRFFPIPKATKFYESKGFQYMYFNEDNE